MIEKASASSSSWWAMIGAQRNKTCLVGLWPRNSLKKYMFMNGEILLSVFVFNFFNFFLKVPDKSPGYSGTCGSTSDAGGSGA